jgi:hypothetical protein
VLLPDQQTIIPTLLPYHCHPRKSTTSIALSLGQQLITQTLSPPHCPPQKNATSIALLPDKQLVQPALLPPHCHPAKESDICCTATRPATLYSDPFSTPTPRPASCIALHPTLSMALKSPLLELPSELIYAIYLEVALDAPEIRLFEGRVVSQDLGGVCRKMRKDMSKIYRQTWSSIRRNLSTRSSQTSTSSLCPSDGQV